MRVLREVEHKLRGRGVDKLEGLNPKGGDVLWVQYRDHVSSVRYKTFTGICLRVVKGGMCVLANSIGGVEVTYGFHSLSPNIKEVKKVQSSNRGGRARIEYKRF